MSVEAGQQRRHYQETDRRRGTNLHQRQTAGLDVGYTMLVFVLFALGRSDPRRAQQRRDRVPGQGLGQAAAKNAYRCRLPGWGARTSSRSWHSRLSRIPCVMAKQSVLTLACTWRRDESYLVRRALLSIVTLASTPFVAK